MVTQKRSYFVEETTNPVRHNLLPSQSVLKCSFNAILTMAIEAYGPANKLVSCPCCQRSDAQVLSIEKVFDGHVAILQGPCGAKWLLDFKEGGEIDRSIISHPCHETRPKDSREVVYFVEAVGSNRVKIGYSSNIANRMKKLSTASPFNLRLLYKMPGTTHDESQLHKLFKDYRITGEWFRLCGDILGYIRYQSRDEKPFSYLNFWEWIQTHQWSIDSTLSITCKEFVKLEKIYKNRDFFGDKAEKVVDPEDQKRHTYWWTQCLCENGNGLRDFQALFYLWEMYRADPTSQGQYTQDRR